MLKVKDLKQWEIEEEQTKTIRKCLKNSCRLVVFEDKKLSDDKTEKLYVQESKRVSEKIKPLRNLTHKPSI